MFNATQNYILKSNKVTYNVLHSAGKWNVSFWWWVEPNTSLQGCSVSTFVADSCWNSGVIMVIVSEEQNFEWQQLQSASDCMVFLWWGQKRQKCGLLVKEKQSWGAFWVLVEMNHWSHCSFGPLSHVVKYFESNLIKDFLRRTAVLPEILSEFLNTSAHEMKRK